MNTERFDLWKPEEYSYPLAFGFKPNLRTYLHEDDRKTAMERCYDALKENGSFISFENISPFSEIGRNVYLDKWKRYQEANGKSPEESSRHIARYGKDYFPINIEEHLKLMRSCGFQAVEVLWFSNMQAGFWGMK